MRSNCELAIVLFAGVALGGLAVEGALADDKLKGTYGAAGIQLCLVAPSGFANDSKGNPTIANGNDSYAFPGNFLARLTFNGDGTGTASGTFVTCLRLRPPKPQWVRAPSRTPSLTLP